MLHMFMMLFAIYLIVVGLFLCTSVSTSSQCSEETLVHKGAKIGSVVLP